MRSKLLFTFAAYIVAVGIAQAKPAISPAPTSVSPTIGLQVQALIQQYFPVSTNPFEFVSIRPIIVIPNVSVHLPTKPY